jgi:UDP-3-O-[3-hydroxymyristoyl] glucosamine N-acyltransferase
VKLEFITIQEAESIKRKMPKSKTMMEYEDYLKQLPEKQVGKLVVDKKDTIKPNTAKARLIRASKNLKLNVQTKRVGSTILFWRE